MATLKELQDELAPYKGTLVIDEMWTVCRLLDVVAEPEDFYWKLKQPKRGTYLSSCVGGWIPLKGKIDDEEYKRLEHYFNINEPYWPQ
jgi:hypothetical protein